ncbi:TraM-binding TraD/TraG-like protein [Haloactinopolyspora alba]|uniref:TraM-binding TraD/TraG-like protein n=2 Tax=Haloactinopolyspora alba TaxID=648780 RepID=A0A2P8EB87_9ACTN|nr:TraM-binding TraD/TraG-like protein [Haloactinopolyspora alba]
MLRRRRRRPTPWDTLREQHPQAAEALDRLAEDDTWSDVDRARILTALERRGDNPAATAELADEIVRYGPATLMHQSSLRDLPGDRKAMHNLQLGQVRLGRTVQDPHADRTLATDFGVDHDVLRTSMLVIGPPGSGKTRGFAWPIVENLSLSALTQQASVVVVDPKGDDFAHDEWFDVTIDPLSPTVGFDLYGGTDQPDTAADRLASAMLPPQVSDDIAYFMDGSRNALYACLAPFHLAFGRWPKIREMLALLRSEQDMTDKVKAALRGPDGKDAKALLDSRHEQATRNADPAASLIERFQLLARPRLMELFDRERPFRMHDINRPMRVRVSLPEAEFPDAARILARLVVSQFVQVTSAPDTNRSIFKALAIDEAGRFVDDYVARGVQKLRSNNAGLLLLAQTISDFPVQVRATVFGSVGCKAVFGGIDPVDAKVFSDWFGEHWVSEVSFSQGESIGGARNAGRSRDSKGGWNRQDGESQTWGTSKGTNLRRVERPRWSVSDIVTGIPPGHCVVSLSRSDGTRTGPTLINLRA